MPDPAGPPAIPATPGYSGRMSTPKTPKPAPGPAWRAAEAYGIDMSLVEACLRRTPAERIRVHCRALATALALREAMRKRDA